MIGNTAGRERLITSRRARPGSGSGLLDIDLTCSGVTTLRQSLPIIVAYRVLVVIRHSVFIAVINASTTITYYRAIGFLFFRRSHVIDIPMNHMIEQSTLLRVIQQ